MENKTIQILVEAGIMFTITFIILSIFGSIKVRGGLGWEHDLEGNIAWSFIIAGIILFGKYREVEGYGKGAEDMTEEFHKMLDEESIDLTKEIEEFTSRIKKQSDSSDGSSS